MDGTTTLTVSRKPESIATFELGSRLVPQFIKQALDVARYQSKTGFHIDPWQIQLDSDGEWRIRTVVLYR